MTQTEALKLALKALDFSTSPSPCVEELQDDAIAAIKEALAQPEQKQNLKLMPREATPEMLKAMDECSTEGYDERLYEGHAGSVYMAAWDAFHGQHCYCGNITNLGVIHRDDGRPCHYPDHKESKPEQYNGKTAPPENWGEISREELIKREIEMLKRIAKAEEALAQPEHEKERCVGCDACIDTACGRDECPKGWPKAAQPEQEPVAFLVYAKGSRRYFTLTFDVEKVPEIYKGGECVPLYSTPPQRKPLTDKEIAWEFPDGFYGEKITRFARSIEAKLKEKNT